PNFRRIVMAAGPPIPPSSVTTLYAAFGASDENLLGIFKSTDGGDSWLRLTNPPAGGHANYNLALAIDPVEPNIIYYGTSSNPIGTGGTLWRSRDGGASWSDISVGVSGGLHADTHAIVIDPRHPNVLFTGNDGGIWRSDNAPEGVTNWTNLNRSLSITQFQSIALHPTDPNILL